MKNTESAKLKNCIITGASSGIGKATAIEMAKFGYRVILLVRNNEKAQLAYEEILLETGNKNLVMYYVDLSSQASLNQVITQIKQDFSEIDILINNAGVLKRSKQLSDDGIEMTLAVNYLATYILSTNLIDLIKKPGGRIVNLTSELYKNGLFELNVDPKGKFDGNLAYATSKKLVVYFTKIFANMYPDISVNCLHPGVIATDSFREYPWIIAKSINLFLPKPRKGAEPVIHLATSPEVKDVTGQYFYKRDKKEINEIEIEKIQQILEETRKLVSKSISQKVN